MNRIGLICIPRKFLIFIEPYFIFPSLYPFTFIAFAPRLLGIGCLCTLFPLILFRVRRFWWLPVLALLTYCHSWCLVSFHYQKCWHQTVHFRPIVSEMDMLPPKWSHRVYVWSPICFMVDTGIFLPTFWFTSLTVAPSDFMISSSVSFWPNWCRFCHLSWLKNTISLSLNIHVFLIRHHCLFSYPCQEV